MSDLFQTLFALAMVGAVVHEFYLLGILWPLLLALGVTALLASPVVFYQLRPGPRQRH